LSTQNPKETAVRQAISGDELAAQELIRIYLQSGELERFIRNQKPHRHADVDALVDDTLLEMRASITSFTPPDAEDGLLPAFEAWLRNFARWNVLDDARHWRTKTQGGDRHEVGDADIELRSEQDVLDFFVADDVTASRVVTDAKITRKLLAVCDFLKHIAHEKDGSFFEPFELYIQEGLTRDEIAERLGLSSGQVGHRLRESMKLLKEEWNRLSAYVSAQG